MERDLGCDKVQTSVAIRRSGHNRGMSKRSSRRPARSAARAAARSRSAGAPSVEDLARVVVQGATALLDLDDPLAGEEWASAVLGNVYKMAVPPEVQDLVDRELVPSIARLAEARGDTAGRAVLEALAAVVDPADVAPVREAAGRMAGRGIAVPAWAGELRTAELTGAWLVTDAAGDHEGYYAVFRYPGRDPHLLTAVVDKAAGEIVKDASLGQLVGDPASVLEALAAAEPGFSVRPVDPAAMARRIVEAIEAGDRLRDTEGTEGFRRTRALLLARMRSTQGRIVNAPPSSGPTTSK